MSDDREPGDSPGENDAPDDKGGEAIEEYGSRTDAEKESAASSEAHRRRASPSPDATRVPNFLPADHGRDH